jgi:hypothetical protein
MASAIEDRFSFREAIDEYVKKRPDSNTDEEDKSHDHTNSLAGAIPNVNNGLPIRAKLIRLGTMKRDIIRESIGVLFLVGAVLIFFARFFYPTPQLLMTPDFGRSDAWHFSFATKYALGEALRQGRLPLWNQYLGGGFPLLAEGQTGSFFLPNLILFSFLPQPLAYSLALVLTFLMLALGMYWWARSLSFSVAASVFTAITVTFSALPVLQLPHITLLQGMSLMPLIASVTVRLAATGKRRWWLALAFLIAQQLFAGFPQATVLTAFLIGWYALFICLRQKNWLLIFEVGSAYLLGAGMGAAQLIPSWEFLRSSASPGGFDGKSASYFSMPLVHLKTFMTPFALGNPARGTYPAFFQFDGSIFWENTAYAGLLPLLFAAYAAWKERKHPYIGLFISLMGASLLMAWGKYSPLYFLFSLPPLNLFRVPSRFLWITIVSTALCAAIGMDAIHKRSQHMRTELLLLIAILLELVQLLTSFWSYHLLAPTSAMLTVPESVARLSPGKTFTIGENVVHNLAFTTRGWQNPSEYLALRNGLSPDANLIWHVPSEEVYAGRFLRRQSLAHALLADSVTIGATTATFSATTQKYLSLFGISNILSYLPIDGLPASFTASPNAVQTPAIYHNPDAVPRAYLVTEATMAATLTQAKTLLASDIFSPGKSVLLETHDGERIPGLAAFTAPNMSRTPTTGSVSIRETKDDVVSMTVTGLAAPAILVFTDTYYPGWSAYVDGDETPIAVANLTQRAIVVPSGDHAVQFAYRPQSVSRGITISIAVALITVVLAVAPFGVARYRTGRR